MSPAPTRPRTGAGLADLSLADMRSVESAITEDIFGAWVRASTVGQVAGAAPANVREQASKPASASRARLGCPRDDDETTAVPQVSGGFRFGRLDAACGRKKVLRTRKVPVIPEHIPTIREAAKQPKQLPKSGHDSWTISTTGTVVSTPRRSTFPTSRKPSARRFTSIPRRPSRSTTRLRQRAGGHGRDRLLRRQGLLQHRRYQDPGRSRLPAPTWFRRGIVPRLDGGDARGQDRFFRVGKPATK